MTLVVPLLRERLEDVPVLAQHFLDKANARSRRPHRFTPASLERFQSHSYPVNVRELENLVEHAAALPEDEDLTADDFPLRKPNTPVGTPAVGAPTPVGGPVQTLETAVNDAEKRAITAALESSPNDLSRVAELLGVSATTLWRKMKRLGLKTTGDEPVN